MKLLKLFFLTILLLYPNNLIADNNEKIAFVDLDFLVKNSTFGKKALEKIVKLDKKNIEQLKKKNKELKDLEEEIIKKKTIISEEAFKKEISILKDKIQSFQQDKNKMVAELDKFKNEEMNKVFEQISPIIKNFMEENSISILLDTKNIFMGKVESNLTEEILKEINKAG